MKSKEYLNRIRYSDRLISSKFRQIKNLEDMATKITMDLSTERVQSSGGDDKISSLVANIVDLQNEITRDIKKLINLKRDVVHKINSLPDASHRMVLTLRYLEFKQWEQIAVEMEYSYQWVHRIHGRALQEFEKLL